MKPKIHPLFRSALVPSLLAVSQVPALMAADITWGTANTIAGDAGSSIALKNFQVDNNVTQNTTNGTADIQSAGTSVFAMNFTGVGGDSWTNRVTFFESTPQQTVFWSANEAGAFTQNGVTLAFGPGWSGNTRIGGNSPQGGSYGAVVGYTWDTLSYMRYMNATSGSLTFSGLTIGQEYAVQYWVQDSRTGLGDVNDRNLTLAGSTPVTLDYNDGSGVGQWAIGTFTADTTTQDIAITASSSVQINMVQLRALPVAFTAADGVWTGGDGNWSTASNWDANAIAQGIDKSATFNGLTPVTAAVDVIRPIGALLFSGADHTLSNGTGSLMLDGDTTYPTPTISVESGRTATIGATLTGVEGLTKTGPGTLTLTGANSLSGITTISAGTLEYQGGTFASAVHSIDSGAVMEFDVAGGIYNASATTINGAGTLRKSGAGELIWPATSATFALDPGALIDVQEGTFTAGSHANENWTANASDLHVAAGATFTTVEANVRVDKLTGAGIVSTGYSGAGYQNLTVGVADGSSTFNGIIANAFAPGNLVKAGSGSITLAGLNTYTGDTTVSGGTLELADNAQLSFVVADGDSNTVGGTGTALIRGDFTIDTSAVTGTAGGIWTLVNLNSLDPASDIDGATFSVIGFDDSDDDGVWTMTDAKGDWSFDESTGELTLDLADDYLTWGAAYSLGAGTEAGDADNDGLTNEEEYAFGLIPNEGASVNPIAVPLDKATGTFSYTRRDSSLTDLTYSVWFSEDLTSWTEDTGAVEGAPVLSGEVETVPVTLSALAGDPLPRKLFIQVRAN